MWLTRIKYLLILAFLAILIVIALPEFSINIAGSQIRFPSVGFSRIGIPSDYPSFAKGKDTFPATKVKINLEISGAEESKEELFNNYIKTVNERRIYANLLDIEVHGIKRESNYALEIIVPDNYTNAESYANWLTATGSLSIISIDSSTNTPNISVEDIVYATKSLVFNYQFFTQGQNSQLITQNGLANGENLYLHVDSTKSQDLQAIPNFQSYTQLVGSNGSSPLKLLINSEQILDIFKDDYNTGIRVLSNPSLSAKERNHLLSIIQSYLQAEEITNIKVTSVFTDRYAPTYNSEGLRFLISIGIIAALLSWFIVYKKSGFKLTLAIVLSFSASFLLGINLLKLAQAPLSLSVIIGIYISMLLLHWLNLWVFSASNEALINRLKSSRTISLIFIFTFLIVSIFRFPAVELVEIPGIVLVFTMSFFATSYTVTNVIAVDYIKKSISFSKAFLKRK